jgi:hypothetical protein
VKGSEGMAIHQFFFVLLQPVVVTVVFYTSIHPPATVTATVLLRTVSVVDCTVSLSPLACDFIILLFLFHSCNCVE